MIRIALCVVLLILLTGPTALLAAQDQHVYKSGEDRDKEQYERSMHERLGKLGSQLDELKKKAESRSAKVEGQMKNRLADAEKKRQAAELKLKELGLASRDSWRKFSLEMEKSAKEFERSFERALKLGD